MGTRRKRPDPSHHYRPIRYSLQSKHSVARFADRRPPRFASGIQSTYASRTIRQQRKAIVEFSVAIKTCLKKSADFTGRAQLSEFWLWALFVLVVGTGAMLLAPVLGGMFFLAALLPSAAAASRRLHDTDRSGWWTLLALLPFPGMLFLAALLVFQGTRGDNRFGPDPLGREAGGRIVPLPGERQKSVAEWQDRQ